MSDQSDLAALVQFATNLEDEIAELDKIWKEKTAKLRQLTEVDIPLMCDELGFSRVDSGEFKLEIKDDWTASVPSYKKIAVCNYAEELGCSSLVSHKIIQEFRRDEQDMFRAATELLVKNQQPHVTIQDINTGSWKAAVKQLVSNGQQVDLDRACVTKLRKAIIKRKDDHG